MPKRIQRKRTKGWRTPEGAIYVGRPSRWGNPFPLAGPFPRARAVLAFRKLAARRLKQDPNWLEPLRGKDLCCWCDLSEPCHADVLLELANATTPRKGGQ
ncbi:MAG TPA: DUF4326 domain-containing protein [Trueperaceae bacterium]